MSLSSLNPSQRPTHCPPDHGRSRAGHRSVFQSTLLQATRVAATALTLIFATSSVSAQGIITDGDANWEYTGAANDGIGNFEADTVDDVLYQHWWWYRLEGDTAETVLDPGAAGAGSYVGNTLTLDWTTPSFTAQATLLLTDGASPGFASLVETMEITNTTADDITIHLFPYIDLDVISSGGDSASAGATADELLITDDDTIVRLQAVDADNFQVGTFPGIRTLLDDTAITDLDGSGLPFGPADFTCAFQWTRTIAAGATETFVVNFGIEVLPCSQGVTGLTCSLDCATGDVDLSWTNGDTYDSIEVEAGGVTSVLPGDATTFVGPGTGDTYTITAICGGLPVPSSTCSVVPAGITGLVCTPDCASGEVSLSWTNPSGYSEIVIEANGIVDMLPGTATSGTLALPDGTFDVTVTPFCAAVALPPSVCSVTIISSGLEEIVIFAGEAVSDIDSVQAVADALDALSQPYTIIDDLTSPPCGVTLTSGTLFAILGTFPDRHILTADEGTLLQTFVTSGGNLFLSGGDTFGFDAQTPAQTIDGLLDGSAIDGDDTLMGLTGFDYSDAIFSDLSAAYMQDQPGNDYTDRLTPATGDALGPNTGVVWVDDMTGGGTGYNVGVFYDTDMGGKVLTTSFEFGGHAGDRTEVMNRVLAAFGGGGTSVDQFRRGDTNNDGGFDISDAVFGLGALFIPGSDAPGCADSSDANDDGMFDVSDAVFMLSALFVPGSAPLPAPGAMCGTDPTMDTLDCVITACP